jgi:hypothetical protein
MNDDNKLIWENYEDNLQSKHHQLEGNSGEVNFEKLPVDELKQLSPEEAKEAIGNLNQIDIAIQKSTDRSFSAEDNSRRSNIHSRVKLLSNIINPPPPDPTPEQREARKAEKKRYLDKFMNARRQLQGLKQQWAQDGTWEKIGKLIPDVKSGSMFGSSGLGVGGVPPELQRYIGMSYLMSEEMPDRDELMDMVKDALATREIVKI